MSNAVAELSSPDQSTAGAQAWETVCALGDIVLDTGVCALFDGQQVAIFREQQSGELFAISNFDPLGGANVLSRGILGSIGERLVVASPLYKQHFDLRSGECLEEEGVRVRTFPVRARDGRVQLAHRAD
ncbi:nitrite reductase small subunit NirD [Proteobacteria bacterium 005FR1]|nr:nitrite reductase small subunit NirD [Proteobacteria bacterium 005FR1]